jgi:hypothetical protein
VLRCLSPLLTIFQLYHSAWSSVLLVEENGKHHRAGFELTTLVVIGIIDFPPTQDSSLLPNIQSKSMSQFNLSQQSSQPVLLQMSMSTCNKWLVKQLNLAVLFCFQQTFTLDTHVSIFPELKICMLWFLYDWLIILFFNFSEIKLQTM